MVVDCAEYCQGSRAANVDLKDVSEILKKPDRFVWIGLHEPDEVMLKSIQKEFGLHDLAVEDALRAHQRPKIETYGDTLFLVLRTVQLKEKRVDLGETHFFIGSNFIVSVRHGTSTRYVDVRARCESTPHLLKKGPAFALYAVMDFIVDQYFPVIDALEDDLTQIEENIFHEKFRKDVISKIYRLKRQLLDVKRSVSPLVDICNKLMRFDLKFVDEETKPYFRDVYDHAIRINEMVDNSRELLSAALEANLSMITISQSEVSKKFAGWAALIAVPTMVAGIYGMNFRFMPELEWVWGYPLIIGLTVSFCVFMYYKFKQSGWV
jgi:magnesium transporter